MKVQVKYYAMIRDLTGKKLETLILPDDATVRDLLHLLIKKYGKKISNYIYDKEKKPRDYLSYVLDGVNIYSLEGFKTELRDGSIFHLLPPIGGGI
jgi:MoaD family protein